jgi:anti-sigma regulatory factor (Ser/Thr protein kinase)
MEGASATVVDRAILMVSEIATNAIQHAGTNFTLRIDRSEDAICFEIIDEGDGVPTVRFTSPSEMSGRGLRIVKELADTWGVRPSALGPGKTVWFTIGLARPG